MDRTQTEPFLGLGNIIGPLTFRDKDKPDYIPAKITIIVTAAFACVMTAILIVYYRWENARRDKKTLGVEHQENSEFFDLTDRENPEFRVSLLRDVRQMSTKFSHLVPVVGSDSTGGPFGHQR